MFGFLKDKFKKAVARFTKEVEEEPKAEEARPEIREKAPAEKKIAVQKKSKEAAKKAEKKEEHSPAKQKTKEPSKKFEEKKDKEPDAKAAVKIETKEPAEIAKQEGNADELEPAVVEEKKAEPKKGFFGRLKDKIKGIPAEKEPTEEEITETTKPKTEEPARIEIEKTEAIAEKAQEAALAEQPEVKKVEEAKPEKEGFFGKITEAFSTRTMSEERFEELFYELEIGLLENNVALEVIDKIRTDLKEELVNKKVKVGKAQEAVEQALNKSIKGLFEVPQIDLVKAAESKKPLVIVFVGVNGSGKTTTIAKMASLFKSVGKVPVIAAADTFRAAAIQQLEEHANRLEVKMIKHDYGSDPAAVAFDAIKYADAKKADIVLIDTAGRLHSNSNLMDEMKKIVRVAKPDFKIFIGEAITGNDCVEQARQFNDAIGIDGIILSKADVDDKGGAAISVSYVTGKPILYLGNGQEYDKLTRFQSSLVTEGLGL